MTPLPPVVGGDAADVPENMPVILSIICFRMYELAKPDTDAVTSDWLPNLQRKYPKRLEKFRLRPMMTRI